MTAKGHKPAIAAVGMFDGVHRGHQSVLNVLHARADALGMKPMVFTFGRHPAAILRPDTPPETLTDTGMRRRLLSLYAGCDIRVLNFTAADLRHTAADFIDNLTARYGVQALVMGYDNRIGSDRIDSDSARRLFVPGKLQQVYTVPPLTVPGFDEPPSSSLIRRLLLTGDIAAANALLGHTYAIAGTVVRGRQVGRQLGFPTANIRPLDPAQLIPANGVYAVDAHLDDGTVRRAVANIGLRPTFGDQDADPGRTIEVHIPGLDADLYGQHIEIRFLRRLRPERRFAGTGELAAQIAGDIRNALGS